MKLQRWAAQAAAIPCLLCILAVPARAEPHPGIHDALNQINHALYILKHRTNNDFHGHKLAAIHLLERARRQLILADRSDQ